VDGLSAFYDRDRERVLERLKLAFRTPALHPRLRQEQAISALAMAKVLAWRLHTSVEDLEIRAIAAAVAAALWVAVEEWQATEGRADLRTLIDRALGTVLAGDVLGTATEEPKPRECRGRRQPQLEPSSNRGGEHVVVEMLAWCGAALSCLLSVPQAIRCCGRSASTASPHSHM
jgi:MftR C-terminal domain